MSIDNEQFEPNQDIIEMRAEMQAFDDAHPTPEMVYGHNSRI